MTDVVAYLTIAAMTAFVTLPVTGEGGLHVGLAFFTVLGVICCTILGSNE